ncbi:MAG: cation-translocating P-type ATPase [Methanomicrobiales archaeon]|nr:cation-translocating P-type ATPase [Methanomicrobiales archaeon]
MSSEHQHTGPEGCHDHGCGCGHAHNHDDKKFRREVIRLFVAGILVVIAVLTEYSIIGPHELEIPAAIAALVLTGYPILKDAILGLINRRWDVCELAALAIVAAVIIGEFTAAAEIALILTIGEIIEEYLYTRTGKEINSLLSTFPTTARVIRNGDEIDLLIEDIVVGDQVIIRPGDSIMVDGKISEGQSAIDESFLSGESHPILKKPGETVFSGSINLDGVLIITAIKPASQSSYAKIVELVKEAGIRRPPSHPMIDRFAKYYTPFILLLASIIVLITGDIIRGITVLIVACPCALLLSTPSAVLAAIGPAAKNGILIKSGKYLEICKKITVIVFDKTGTLTSGEMSITGIIPENGVSEEEILKVAGSAERSSPHPVAKAIIKEAQTRGIVYTGPMRARHIPGKGAFDTFNNSSIIVGNRDFLIENSVLIPDDAKDSKADNDHYETEVLIAKDGQYIGRLLVADTLRHDTKNALSSLQKLGYNRIAMITGDNKYVARRIAKELDIPESMTYSGFHPVQKEEYIASLQEKGEVVCFVGDGTNDGPALTRADLGIGMGSRENTLALESSGVILMQEGLFTLPSFLSLGKRTRRTIEINIILAMALNFILIGIAAGGMISPVLGAIGHQIATIVVLLNSIWLSWIGSGV